ncbi:MAG TPA: branched-chain amino acid ABC transporter permease, partial [Candidatus Kapabacteria bacterium]
AMRAVSFNQQAASLMGINISKIITFTFIVGSALAGAGGVLYGTEYPSIDPLMGILPGLKAFVAAVLGGIGNIPGAALGGLIIGLVETFVSGTAASTYRDAIAFAILIAILVFKPSGLLGKREVEKV